MKQLKLILLILLICGLITCIFFNFYNIVISILAGILLIYCIVKYEDKKSLTIMLFISTLLLSFYFMQSFKYHHEHREVIQGDKVPHIKHRQ